MKFYSILIKYRLYIGSALIILGVITNIYSSFWPAFLLYFVGVILIFGHFFFGPLRLIQEHMESGNLEDRLALGRESTYPRLNEKRRRKGCQNKGIQSTISCTDPSGNFRGAPINYGFTAK